MTRNPAKYIGSAFLLIGITLGAIFFMAIDFPIGLESYFRRAYYQQFGPLGMSIELALAGYYLFIKHKQVNFFLALFAFTVLFDVLFTMTGLFSSGVPLYGLIIFSGCALISFGLSFTNAYELGRISWTKAVGSVLMGTIFELFFNYI